MDEQLDALDERGKKAAADAADPMDAASAADPMDAASAAEPEDAASASVPDGPADGPTGAPASAPSPARRFHAPKLTRRSLVGAGVAALAVGAGAAFGIARCTAGDASVPSEPKSPEPGASAGPDSRRGGKLVMYTCCDDGLVNAFVPAFMQETGIVVDVRRMTASECRDSVAEEVAAGRPIADVVWGGDESWYAAGEADYEKYFSSENANVLDGCRNTSGYVTPATREVCVIAVNSARAEELSVEIEGYADLLDERLAGLVAVADAGTDAAAKSSAEAARAAGDLLSAFSTTVEDGSAQPGGDAFLAALEAQAGGNVRATSEDVLEDVLSGAAVTGLVYEQQAAAMTRLTGEVEVVLPREGCLVAHGCTAIVRGATNLAQAQGWVDFVCGETAQKGAAAKVRLRSVRDGVGEKDDFVQLTVGKA